MTSNYWDDEYFFQHVGFVVKISERCNLACKYCYFFFHKDDSYKDNPATMGLDVAEDYGKFIASMGRSHGVKRVTVGLHGGEPLLVTKKRFQKLCDTIIENADDVEITFGIQTNGALIDDGWLKIFKKYQLGVGISLDGTEAVNDANRIDKKGRGSHADCAAGFIKVRDYNKENNLPPPGILCVIDPYANSKETFVHFFEELNAARANYLVQNNTHDDNISDEFIEKLGDFLIETFEHWQARKELEAEGGRPAPSIRYINETLRGMVNDSMAFIYEHTYNDFRNLFTISSDGTISPEDSLKGGIEPYAITGFNIEEHGLGDLSESYFYQELKNSYVKKPAGCVGCDFWRVCRGGKPINRYRTQNGFDNPSVYCSALKRYYISVMDFLIESGYEKSEILNRLTCDETDLVPDNFTLAEPHRQSA